MGFKTGKTIGELGMTETILDMLDKKVMIISHERAGDGLSDGASITPEAENVTIPVIGSEYGDELPEPIVIPVKNIAKGILSGHSIFLTDVEGEEVQISFLTGESVDLEAKAYSLPICLDDARETAKANPELSVWSVVVDVFNLELDPRKKVYSQAIAVAASSQASAREQAEEVARQELPGTSITHFSADGTEAKPYDPI